MANKNYNLTQKPNEHIKDKSPDWLDMFFNNPTKEIDNDKEVKALKDIKSIYDL